DADVRADLQAAASVEAATSIDDGAGADARAEAAVAAWTVRPEVAAKLHRAAVSHLDPHHPVVPATPDRVRRDPADDVVGGVVQAVGCKPSHETRSRAPSFSLSKPRGDGRHRDVGFASKRRAASKAPSKNPTVIAIRNQ